jgi:hypothetical protein
MYLFVHLLYRHCHFRRCSVSFKDLALAFFSGIFFVPGRFLAFFNGIFGSKRRYFSAFPSFYGVTRLISSLQASWRKIRVRLGLEVVKIKKNDRKFSKISNFNGIFGLWQLIFRPIFPAFLLLLRLRMPENGHFPAFSALMPAKRNTAEVDT